MGDNCTEVEASSGARSVCNTALGREKITSNVSNEDQPSCYHLQKPIKKMIGLVFDRDQTQTG